MMGLTFGGLSGYGAYLSSKDSRNFWLLFCMCASFLFLSFYVSLSVFMCHKREMLQHHGAVYVDAVS